MSKNAAVEFALQNPHGAVVFRDDLHRKEGESAQVRKVKNLGWLLRNWQVVLWLKVSPVPEGSSQNYDCVLEATIAGGRCFACTWASKDVLWTWLQRPVFFGVQLDWFGKELTIVKGEKQP